MWCFITLFFSKSLQTYFHVCLVSICLFFLYSIFVGLPCLMMSVPGGHSCFLSFFFTVTGLGVGIVFSVLLFKRKCYLLKQFFVDQLLLNRRRTDVFLLPGRTWPVSFGSGLGLGMGYSNCQHDFRSPYLIHGRMVKVSTQSKMRSLEAIMTRKCVILNNFCFALQDQ